MSEVPKHWKYKEIKDFSPELLEISGSKIIAQLLANRGITDTIEAEEFLNISEEQLSSPYEFEDMPKLIERVDQAVENNEHIVIYGDFDADGITGTSILFKALRHIGANVSFYVPERVSEGHGLNASSLLKLISIRQTKLIITTDCGVGNIQEIALAKNFNVDVIVTDHHELPEILPLAVAIINPKMLLPSSKMAYLCGAGVAYKVAQALLDHFEEPEFLKELLHLATIGTIADLVPLIKENRVLTYLGINSIIENTPPAIEEIAKIAQLKLDDTFNSESIAFQIGPRLNAIGRLDNASIAVELLTSEDPEVIKNLAKQIDHLNRKRQELCDQTYQEAVAKLAGVDIEKQKAIVLESEHWHAGIIGIVASKLIETYYKPTFLMTVQGNDVRGSARSIEGVHLYNVLSRIGHLFTQYGGHELAAGFNLEKKDLLKFKQAIISEVQKDLKNIDTTPSIEIEMDINLEDVNIELIDKINKLAPFGMNNPTPLFSCSDVRVVNQKVIGANSNHLRIVLGAENIQPVEAVWWQHGSIGFDKSVPVSAAFYPKINTFNNNKRIQMIIKDIVSLESYNQAQAITENNIKWVDHRNKSDITPLFKNYLKMKEAKIAVFAESKQSQDNINLDCELINRTNTDNFEQIILFEYPPDESVLRDVINNISPQIVHLSPARFQKPLNEMDIIKNVIGMLKYAHFNMNGEANIINMAAKLGTSIKVVSSAIDVLHTADFIQLISYVDNIVKFKLKEISKTDMSKFPEMQKLKAEMLKVHEYRKNLLTLPVEAYSKL